MGVGGVQSHTAASQAAGAAGPVVSWVPVAGSPSRSLSLRALAGSSDELVRGAGRRPLLTAFPEGREGNEGWVREAPGL